MKYVDSYTKSGIIVIGGGRIMDTIKVIPMSIIKDFDSLFIADLTVEERKRISNHVALTKDVIEANQLFEAFYFNLLNMRNSFVFNISDTVFKTEHCPDFDSEFIAINSLVVNLISSAKILTEYLRETANRWLGNGKSKEDKYKDEYNSYVSEIYDKSFNYRLLINLRNYMQHGYLPVSFQDGKYSFDVTQILRTPHFKINGHLKTDMNNFITKLEIPGETIPCISLTLTIADFSVKVIDVYRKFLFYIKKNILSSHICIQKLIQSKPSIVCEYNEQLKGYIIYDEDLNERTYHAFKANDAPNKTIASYEKKVSDIYKYEKKEYDILHSHLKIKLDISL